MVAGYNSGNPIVLGHEFVETVESCPEASHQLGRRVWGKLMLVAVVARIACKGIFTTAWGEYVWVSLIKMGPLQNSWLCRW